MPADSAHLAARVVSETGVSSHSSDLELSVPQGTVRWFDAERGFGFLAPQDGDADLFVHASEIVGDGVSRLLREGQAVEYEVGEGERGPQARGVRVTGEIAADAALGVLGTIKWYEPAKGYGFASPDGGGAEVFVHSSAIVPVCPMPMTAPTAACPGTTRARASASSVLTPVVRTSSSMSGHWLRG